MPIEKLLTSQEVGALLGIHYKVAERMARRGELPGFKVGKFWRYRPSALAAWLESKAQPVSQPSATTSF